MTAPFLSAAPALLAVPIGIAFGAALERAGLGSARTIAAQLAGRDFTVVKVMFSAIVTAMLGLFWASRLGWLDLSRVATPETDIVPQLIGAVLFGAGFAIASLCPGTACVAAGSGHRDGLFTIGGLFLGTLVTAELWPRLGAAAELAPRDARLPADLGWPTGVVVAVITLAAIAVIRLSTSRERGAEETPVVDRRLTVLTTLAATLGILAAAIGNPSPVSPQVLTSIATDIARQADHVDAVDLAGWIHDGRRGLRVIDVRDAVAPREYRIPGAELVSLESVPHLDVHEGETIVLYSDGGAYAAQAWVLLRTRGFRNVYVLRDGLDAWHDEVMRPHLPVGGDSAALARYSRARELSPWFEIQPNVSAPPPAGNNPAPSPPKPIRRRRSC
ncbi:MAG: YeeE/YedE thiosulfate transporter family protein [Gemmatimonadota bacterium]